MGKRKRNGKEEVWEEDKPKKREKIEKRVVKNPLIVQIKKLEWKELHLDESKTSVAVLLEGNQKTLQQFLTATSRFRYWIGTLDQNPIYDEKLLLTYLEDFIFRLSDSDGNCVLSAASFFTELSHVKKYLSLAHGIRFGKLQDVNAFISSLSKHHVPRKAEIFSFQNLEEFTKRTMTKGKEPLEIQETILSLFAFFCFARACEVIKVTFKNVKIDGKKLLVTLIRTKTKVIRGTYIVEGTGFFDLVAAWKSHKELMENSLGDRFGPETRVFNPEDYSGHSFRRSAASELANSGGSTLELQNAGNWDSSKIAQGYVAESRSAQQRTADLLVGRISGHSSSSSSGTPMVFNNCTFQGPLF